LDKTIKAQTRANPELETTPAESFKHPTVPIKLTHRVKSYRSDEQQFPEFAGQVQ